MAQMLSPPKRLAIISLVLVSLAFARQDTEPKSKLPTKAEIANRLKGLESVADKAAKEKAQGLYRQAQQLLGGLDETQKKGAEFLRMSESAKADLDDAQKKLAAPVEPLPALPPNIDVPGLEQKKVELETDLQQALEERSRLTAEPARRQKRLAELPDEIKAVMKELGEVRDQIGMPPPRNEPAAVSEARQTLLRVREHSLQNQLTLLEQEQAAYSATAELLPLQKRLAEQRVTRLEEQLDRVRRELADRKLSDAEKLVRETKAELDRSPEPLRGFARRTMELAEKNASWLEQTATIEAQAQSLQQRLGDVEATHKRIQERVESVGLNEALGIQLRRERGRLMQMCQELRLTPPRQSAMRNLQGELYQLEDEGNTRVKPEDVAKRYLRGRNDLDKLLDEATKYVSKQRLVREKAIVSGEALFRKLVALENAEQDLRREIDDFQTFIAERILWIRSAGVLGISDFSTATDALRGMVFDRVWLDVAKNLWKKILRMPGVTFLLVGLCVVLGLARLPLSRWIGRTTEEARTRECRSIRPTLHALLGTAGRALLWPTCLYVAGWYLYWEPAPEVMYSLGSGLLAGAFFLFPFELLRQACRRDGLAEGHLGWLTSRCQFLRRHLLWFAPLATLLFVASETLQAQKNEVWRNSLGRLLCLVFLLLLAGFGRLLFSRETGVLGHEPKEGSSREHRLRPVWLWASTLGPLALFVLAVLGYFYSAYHLLENLLETISLAIGLTLAHGLLLRWAKVRRRRVAELARQQKAEAPAPAVESFEGVPLEEEPVLDLLEVTEQSKQLVRTSLWMAALVGVFLIWLDVFPAFSILDKVSLWRVSIGSRVEVVTLRDIVLASVTIGLMVVIVRNSNGLFGVLLLERMPLDAGARYALSTMLRYLVVLIGLIVGLSFLHIQWAQYSWLVAAVTVGVGFGLQEIFANFISGIILLLERPIRVGDVITVGNDIGVVSRIRIRATTVTTLDRQELVVPNKELVTGKILNWTLSNKMTRIVIEVGVPYGTDADSTRAILRQVVESHPLTLADPAPVVLLEQFADSALKFSIRCFLSDLERRFDAIHELHSQIAQAFAEAGIVIPFPQRDIHIYSSVGSEGVGSRE